MPLFVAALPKRPARSVAIRRGAEHLSPAGWTRRYASKTCAALLIAFACMTGEVSAQPSPNRIGILASGSPSPRFESFEREIVAEFASLGYSGDRQVIIESRLARQKLDRLPALAEELVAANVDLIISFGGPASAASQKATSTIPVIFSIETDPVALKLVASMERPGANVTGITSYDPQQPAEQFRLLREALPDIERAAILSVRSIPGADQQGVAPIDRASVAAARAAGFVPQLIKLTDTTDLEAAFAEMKKDKAQALLVLEAPVLWETRQKIGELAIRHRLPTMFPGGQADANGMITYGTSVTDAWRQVVAVADKVLSGARPRNVPVHVVARRELIIDLRTARAVGVDIPLRLVKRADRVVD